VGKNDEIYLKGGSDQVRANTYGADKDVIKGGAGFDLIYVTDDGHPRQDLRGQGQRQVLRERPQGGRLRLLGYHSPPVAHQATHYGDSAAGVLAIAGAPAFFAMPRSVGAATG
jgi:hypothetical protein